MIVLTRSVRKVATIKYAVPTSLLLVILPINGRLKAKAAGIIDVNPKCIDIV